MNETPEIERRIHNGRGLLGHTTDNGDEVMGWAEVAYEAIRATNHLTLNMTIPAPVAYRMLGELKGVGHLLPQALAQLARGLEESLADFEVTDNEGDPAANIDLARDRLAAAAEHAAQLGAQLEAAQSAIRSQGYNTAAEPS